MKLGRRNLFYSLILAGIMMMFLVGYFVYMLPSLYVDYVNEQNLKAIKEQHNAYVKDGTYENVQVKNPTACLSVKIPEEGSSLHITGKAFSLKLTAKEEKMRKIFTEVKEELKNYWELEGEFETEEIKKQLEQKAEQWKASLSEIVEESFSLPFEAEFLYLQDNKMEYRNEYIKFHPVSDTKMILETRVEDSENKYTNYIAMEKTQEGVIFSILPVMTPEMSEITPIVIQSLPMLAAVILLMVLLFSQVYSKGIVNPIVRLVQHTQYMKNSEDFSVEPLSEKEKRKDEIGELAKTVDDLYLQLKENYRELEEKNRALETENKRQDMFMRASSHQLKTPISAALLLLDGMISKIGKYKDTEKYLPKVKKQLLSMRKMVEDILLLNRRNENLCFQTIEVHDLIERHLGAYRVAAADKQLQITFYKEQEMQVCTDEIILGQIIDNLLANAVNYTPEKEKIEIRLHRNIVVIRNYGVFIPEEILPHIFDPFVGGNHNNGGHGMGLYIASYYAKQIGTELSVINEDGCVTARIEFPQPRTFI